MYRGVGLPRCRYAEASLLRKHQAQEIKLHARAAEAGISDTLGSLKHCGEAMAG